MVKSKEDKIAKAEANSDDTAPTSPYYSGIAVGPIGDDNGEFFHDQQVRYPDLAVGPLKAAPAASAYFPGIAVGPLPAKE